MRSPSRGTLWQEISFVSQKLEITRAGEVMLKKNATTCQKEITKKGETSFPCD